LPETTIYLDTNQFVRVFERESETLFPRFAESLEKNNQKLVVSEADVLEIYQGIEKGASIDKIRKGFDLVESLNPLWLRIGDLDGQELRTAFVHYQKGEQFEGLKPFLSWTEFLSAILNSRHVFVLIDLAMSSVSYAFDYLYKNNLMLGRDWQPDLDISSEWFRSTNQRTSRDKAFREHFIRTVMHTCKALSQDGELLQRFANELWNMPGVCPGFRLTFEVTVSLLGDKQPAWTTNRFYDQRHIVAIPYVDKFVGLDRGQRHAVSEFDRRIGESAGINYSSRCYRQIEDALGAHDAPA
jgi:hypothetical protein